MWAKGFKITSFLIIAKTVEGSKLKKVPNTYKFSKNDINKFILLLRKGIYPYEYIDLWARFNQTTLPNEKAFYSKLYLEYITDKYYIYTQKVVE